MLRCRRRAGRAYWRARARVEGRRRSPLRPLEPEKHGAKHGGKQRRKQRWRAGFRLPGDAKPRWKTTGKTTVSAERRRLEQPPSNHKKRAGQGRTGHSDRRKSPAKSLVRRASGGGRKSARKSASRHLGARY